MTPISEQPVDIRQAAGADVIAALTGGDDQVERPGFAIVLEPMAQIGSSVADGVPPLVVMPPLVRPIRRPRPPS